MYLALEVDAIFNHLPRLPNTAREGRQIQLCDSSEEDEACGETTVEQDKLEPISEARAAAIIKLASQPRNRRRR